MILIINAFACMLAVYSSICLGYQVNEVNSSNLNFVLAHQPLLLEFYAPWCSHCRDFEPSFGVIANTLSEESGFKVGKVDVSANPALSSLFEIRGIPVFFLCRDNKIWRYDNYHEYGTDEIIHFARKGYENEEPISFWRSPIGPIGWSKRLLINTGETLSTAVPTLANKFGVSNIVAMLLIGFAVAIFILFVTIIGIYFSVVHAKND